MSVNHVFGKNFTQKIIKTCFMKYLITSLIKRQQKKESKAFTVLQKRGGGGPARYDHDHSFNGIFLPLPLLTVVNCPIYRSKGAKANKGQIGKVHAGKGQKVR